MPEVTGMSITDAKKALKELGLEVVDGKVDLKRFGMKIEKTD